MSSLRPAHVPLLGIGVLRDVLGDGSSITAWRMSVTVSATASSFISSTRWSKMTLRWSFITSSNFRMFLRMSKLRASTFCCAFSSALLIQGWTIASFSFSPSFVQHAVELVGAEDAHQVVFQRQEELGAARVALAAGAAAQLVVDAAAFVALGAEHEQAAGLERGFLQPRDLGADLVRPRLARSSFGVSLSSWRMRMSALPPS